MFGGGAILSELRKSENDERNIVVEDLYVTAPLKGLRTKLWAFIRLFLFLFLLAAYNDDDDEATDDDDAEAEVSAAASSAFDVGCVNANLLLFPVNLCDVTEDEDTDDDDDDVRRDILANKFVVRSRPCL